MGISLMHQTQTFLLSCMLGVGLGLVYDLIRITRMAAVPPGWLTVLEDLLFFFVAGLFSFGFMLNNNMGEVRYFVLLGELLGFIFYRYAFSSGVLGVGRDLLSVLERIGRTLYKWVIRPIVRIFKGLIDLVLKPLRFLGNLAKKIILKAKIGLKRQRIMLYNLCTVNFGQRKEDKKKLLKPFTRIGREQRDSEKASQNGIFYKIAGGCRGRFCGRSAGEPSNQNRRRRKRAGAGAGQGQGTDSGQ